MIRLVIFRRMALWCLILSVISLNGCAYKDIDKRFFVTGIGIDYSGDHNKPFKVTLKLVIPSGNIRETEAKFTYITAESASVSQALRDLKTAVDKELDFSHSRIIILGKGILTLDIKDATDLVLRRRDIQMVSWISVGEPTAEEVLKLETPSEVASSISLVNFFTETAVDSPLIVPTFLFDFQRKMNEKGIDPVLPIIQIDKKEKKYIVNRSIVIGEKKNVELTSHQTRMYSSLSGEKNQLNLEVEHNDYDDYKFGLFIDSSNVKYKIITENDNPIIKMDVSLSGIIEDAKINTDAKKLEHYGQEASKLAKAHLTEVLQFFQKEQIDPIGFGLRYKATRLNTNNTYKVWQDIYPKIKFDVNVDVNVKSTGTIE